LGTLKFKKGGMEFEYVEEPQEIEILINRLAGIETTNTPAQKKLFNGTENVQTVVSAPMRLSSVPVYTRARISVINLPLFPDDEVKAYIKSKPEYRHTLAEIQERFFGKAFKSRGDTSSMYHRTSRQLVDVRRLIEREENGYFDPQDLGGNVIEYQFKKNLVALENKS
jgi:hypothetical protein